MAEDNWITVAVVGKPRGNRGEVTAEPFSSKPERLESLRHVYLFGDGQSWEVENAWHHNGTLILKFRGIDSISDAEKLRGAEVRVPRAERAPLDAGEYFQSDLVGCEVVDRRTGALMGRVTGWDEGGGAGLLVMDDGTLIPFATSICVQIDPERKRIEVELPEGLKELNAP